jgi:hypothetical protein
LPDFAALDTTACAQLFEGEAFRLKTAGEVELEPGCGIYDELRPCGVEGVFFVSIVRQVFFKNNILVKI